MAFGHIRLTRVAAAAATAIVVSSIGSPTIASPTVARAAPAPAGFDRLCPDMGRHDGLPLCKSFYGGDRWIHVPPSPDRHHLYGGVGVGRQGKFYTRTGAALRIKADVNPFISEDLELRKWITTVYLATVKHGTVTAIEPRALITHRAFLEKMYGGTVWEGRIATFDHHAVGVDAHWSSLDEKTLPIRIVFKSAAVRQIDEDGNPIETLQGRIVNTWVSRRSSAGRCFPAIARERRTPIFDGRTGGIRITRLHGMHEPGDAHLLLNWIHGDGEEMASGVRMGDVAMAMGVGKTPMSPFNFDNHASDRHAGPDLWRFHPAEGGGQRC